MAGRKKTFKRVQKELQALREGEGLTLREMAGRFKHLTYGDISRILRGIEPREARKRLELGLAASGPAPVCPVHLVVHVGSCPRERQPRDLFSYRRDVLARMVWRAVEELRNHR